MLHIIQNDPEVPPGNIIDFLPRPCFVHHPYRGDLLPEPSQVSALIVLGGAMGAHDDLRYPFLGDVKNLISKIVAGRIPYLGICLGGQLLAAVLEAHVESGRWEELGTLPVQLTEQGKEDLLFRGIPELFSTFQWHHDSFDIPVGGVLLASSDACPHQAFRVGKTAWGLQFHPEVTEKIIRDWCAWDASATIQMEELVAVFTDNEKNYRATARRFLQNFLQVAGITS